MAEVWRYKVVDADGHVVNIIMWDGEAQYDPGEGLMLERVDDPDERVHIHGDEPADETPKRARKKASPKPADK